jgi:hypothetical protein
MNKSDPANVFEIESYKEIYPATLEPSYVLYGSGGKKYLPKYKKNVAIFNFECIFGPMLNPRNS